MSNTTPADPLRKQRAKEKLARIPVKIEPSEQVLPKPDWIRVKLSSPAAVDKVKQMVKDNKLHTVCEEASCPNLPECFAKGTATFMIMGDKCTRRCTFCDVAHGRPDPLDTEEPLHLAQTVAKMGLQYVVVTSVDRDDLRDGGAAHFAECTHRLRELNPGLKIEVLVPDFRGRMEKALDALSLGLPDVFNHNVETVPRLYKSVRPGSDYHWSLDLIKQFKQRHPMIPTKSGLMLGLGEEIAEVEAVMQDLRDHGCDMLTLGQYLQPSRFHHPVMSYVHPDEFARLAEVGQAMGFSNVASGPLVRSSYHADLQASGETVS